MLQDVVHPPEQLQIEDMSSPVAAHMFDFCDPSLFPETLQNSDVSSCSGCCYEETSYTNDLSFSSSFPSDIPNFTDVPAAAATAPSSLLHDSHTEINKADHHQLPSSLDHHQHHHHHHHLIPSSSMPMISSPRDHQVSSASFSALHHYNDHFDLASIQMPLADADGARGLNIAQFSSDAVVVPLGGDRINLPGCSLGTVFEEADNALSSMPPSYVRMDPASPSSSSFLDHHPGMGGFGLAASLDGGMCPDISGIFQGSIVTDSGLTSGDLEFQGENCGVYCSDSLYASGELQVIGESQQQMMKNSCGSPAGLTSDMSNLEEQGGFGKPPRITLEERKMKIRRYRKKRNERNFNKKIKYACRKTLADSRPRVRGRFAKNDEFGEAARPGRSSHEDELEDEGGGMGMMMKEEEAQEDQMVDSSDILAQISGLNSFKSNFPIPSWS